QSEQAPASPPQAGQIPAKRKATEELQHNRPPTQPGTLPFMWNLSTTPSLPIFHADSTPDASDDEYEHDLELENDELIDELAETKEQLHEAEKKIAALAKHLRMYQVTVLPSDYKTTADNDEAAKKSGNGQSTPEREAEALRKAWEEREDKDEDDDDRDKIEVYRMVFQDIEWAVDEHHRLVHQALGEIEKRRTGPAGSPDGYKPGQLPLYILDKSQCTLGCDVDSLKELFDKILKNAGIVE
ncbi:hypothetical protein QBC32DRAFT_220913, partial [Pseudoneurospora amorphoporcata]